jgi:sugar/nucleoside kinase (ribokinase family)
MASQVAIVEAQEAPGDVAKTPLVAVVGDAAIDIHLMVEDWEQTDEKVDASRGLRLVGGTGANAAAAIVRLGGRSRLHASIGSDLIGEWIEAELASVGVDTSRLVRRAARSTLAIIIHGDGRRRVIVDRGVADQLDDVDPAEVSRGSALTYLSGVPIPYVEWMLNARTGPVVVGFEARQAHALAALGSPSAITTLLDRAATIVTNVAGAAALTDVIPKLRHAHVVVTRGASGARLIRRGQVSLDVPAPPVTAEDATGAGDCFAGTLCRFLAVGTSIERSVTLATTAATLSTRRLGAQAGLPSMDELIEAVDV